MNARTLLIAAPRSGSGKTVVTLGLLRALARRGIAVRAAKTGPDYIDAAFHSAATGVPAVNLDSWAMAPALLDSLVAEAARGADVLLIEGAMGLFDGIPAPPGRSGAASDLSARLRIPALLVLDVSGQGQSAAALVRGFAFHDPAVRIAGVVLNRVASERHHRLVSDAVARLGIRVLGALPRDGNLTFPERHLGLVQAGEHADLCSRLDRLAEAAERHLDLDAVLSSCEALDRMPSSRAPVLAPPGRRIALAADDAFSFVYAHLLDHWRAAGAEIVRFSPLADERPPSSCDTCWLPGGYPEFYAARLAAAKRFIEGLRSFAASRPVHGECGGYMVLGESLEDADGMRHAMTGLLGHRTSFADRRLHLGYREARLLAGSPIGCAGSIVRGHEFHYATLASPPRDEPLVELSDGEGRPLGRAGSRRGHVTGTFFHAIAPA
jgi:cobyrinic acid a,c-diamide synthase